MFSEAFAKRFLPFMSASVSNWVPRYIYLHYFQVSSLPHCISQSFQDFKVSLVWRVWYYALNPINFICIWQRFDRFLIHAGIVVMVYELQQWWWVKCLGKVESEQNG